jgi:hypothetical protein
MTKPDPEQRAALKEQFSESDQARLKQRLSQDAYRHFEDALHGSRSATESEIEEWKRHLP